MRPRTPAPYLFAFLIALITVPGPAFAALHLVMQPVGINQGTILGNSTVPR